MFHNLKRIPPVRQAGALKLLKQGASLNAAKMETRIGPHVFFVHAFSTGELVWSVIVHRMAFEEGLLDFEPFGADEENPAHWHYMLTPAGEEAAKASEHTRGVAGGEGLRTSAAPFSVALSVPPWGASGSRQERHGRGGRWADESGAAVVSAARLWQLLRS